MKLPRERQPAAGQVEIQKNPELVGHAAKNVHRPARTVANRHIDPAVQIGQCAANRIRDDWVRVDNEDRQALASSSRHVHSGSCGWEGRRQCHREHLETIVYRPLPNPEARCRLGTRCRADSAKGAHGQRTDRAGIPGKQGKSAAHQDAREDD
ncbi:hypothetical protein QZM91_11695 [Burkholderia multivorans]|nr:hypothetical protein [Burkholderia multivorans]